MKRHIHQSPVRFADDETIAELTDAAMNGVDLGAHKGSLVSKMFDRTRVSIHAALAEAPVDLEDPDTRNTAREAIADRIVKAIMVMKHFLDLRSKEWKNAPLVWEMLSFNDEILHDKNTPLPEALREAIDRTAHLLGEGVDADELMEDIDEVIHQTHGRRSAIERVMNAAVSAEVSNTNLLGTHSIPSTLMTQVHDHVKQELATTDQVLSEAAARAICERCTEGDCADHAPDFSIGKDDVTRVEPKEAMESAVGDVYLVRSTNVSTLGDHYIVIIGGLIQKPHGLRPADMSFLVDADEQKLLDSFGNDPLILLKLHDAARVRFYDAYSVPAEYRRP